MFNDSANLLRVFVDADDKFGDLASVVVDEGRRISDKERQKITEQLNTGETIFINNVEKANITVMHPQGEIDFAGVGVLGAAWFLAKLRGKPTESMQGRAEEIICWSDHELIWTKAPLMIMPHWNFKQRMSNLEIDEMKVKDTKDIIHTMFWAWIDKEKGLIRARTFASDWDIPEAEGNGSGSMLLAAKLNKEITIMHGKGSVIYARPGENSFVEVGGRVIEV